MKSQKLTTSSPTADHPTIWLVQDNQLNIYKAGELIACIPESQFLKLIGRLALHLDLKE